MQTNTFVKELTSVLSGCENILGIARTGDIHAPLLPGKSDIDLFVLCSTVPSLEDRKCLYKSLEGTFDSLSMEVCSGGVWGYGDIFISNGIDVMPMYFSAEEMRSYVEEVLSGLHLEKEGRFYPVGRLASIESIHVLYETDNTWSDTIRMVQKRPQPLFAKWYASEIRKVLDEEDLGRAELRHEVLFYHQVMEEFLDHFLQALYAKNNCYFPSRKRTEAALASFDKKPDQCYQRLLNIVKLAGDETTIDASIKELRAISEELKKL